MGILQRFKEIMASNVNAALDKMEDPSKMVDQILRELNDNLNQVKSETAGLMAEEARCKRAFDDCAEEVEKLAGYAKKAVELGNDDDARQFLTKKAELNTKLQALKQSYDLAAENSQRMRLMHDKLTQQISEMNSRREAIKAKMSVAKTQDKINKISSAVDDAKSNLSAFDRMEQKADNTLDRANAMAELSRKADSTDDLMNKYDGMGKSSVEDELAALKAETRGN